LQNNNKKKATTMPIDTCSFQSIATVLLTWELVKQNYSTVEKIGIDYIRRLLSQYPQFKTIFGFRADQDIMSKQLRIHAGILVNALLVIDTVDSILNCIGPDTDDLLNLLKEGIPLLLKAKISPYDIIESSKVAKDSLRICFGSRWNETMDIAWDEFLTKLMMTVVELM
jgi:Globin